MNILLYNISYHSDMPTKVFVPLAFILLEEYLTNNLPSVNVKRYDYIVDDPRSLPAANLEQYDLIGCQLTYSNGQDILAILDKLPAPEHGRPFIVLGGVLASAIAFPLLEQYPLIDVVVVAEGEVSLLQLCQYKQGYGKLADIPGIAYRDETGAVVYNKGKRPISFDETPVAKRSFLAEVPPHVLRTSSIRVQTARGCLGGCAFCQNSHKNRLDKITSKAWRGMSPERIIDEIRYLYETFGIQIINFVDPSFEDPGSKGKLRIRRIAELILAHSLPISFKVNMRAETFNDDDIDLLKLLKQAGMDIIVLGVEACNDKDLRLLGKNANSKTITEAFWRLSSLDCFSILVGYMPIHPYVSLANLAKSYEYIHQLGLSYAYNIFRNALIPLRGTNIFDRMMNDKMITNPEKILAIPEYKFSNPEIAPINASIQHLKVNYPALNNLHKIILDANNIVARSTNPIFSSLLNDQAGNILFQNFKQQFYALRHELGECFYSLQKFMLAQAKKRWSHKAFIQFADQALLAKVPTIQQDCQGLITHYLSGVQHLGHDTSILESQAWGSHCMEKNKVNPAQ